MDLLHKDAAFQERIRVLLANPGRSEFLVVTRPSTLETDSRAMLDRRYTPVHVFATGSIVAAKKANWSRGAFDAVQSSEAWTVWAPKGLGAEACAQMRGRLEAMRLSRDGVVPCDPACPSMGETRLGASGHLYDRSGVIAATDGSVKKDGSMGAGVSWSRQDLAPISFEVHGSPKSIIPELSGLAVAADRAPMDEDLTILTDSKSALLLLQGMQRQDFPVFLHRRAERRLLESTVRALNRRAAAGKHTHLVKVKAHSGEPLNTIADLLASQAAGQDLSRHVLDEHTVYFYLRDRPVVWGPRLRQYLSETAASKRLERLRKDYVSRDFSSGVESLVESTQPRRMNWTENWMARQGMGRSTLGAALKRIEISPGKRRILQTMAGMFPGRALLFKWGRADTSHCPLCNAQSESQCHIQCVCPRLERARTAAHHQIARCLWSEIERWQRGARDDFTIVPEVPIDEIREVAPIRCRSSWDRLWAQFFDPAVAPLAPPRADLGRLRPDAVAIRWDRRSLFLLEVTRPYDSKLDFSERADLTKLARYQAVVDRFKAVAPHWHAETIPFTIGIRGTFDEGAWSRRLADLDISQDSIPRLLNRVVDVALSALDVVYEARSSALREDPSNDDRN